MPDRRLQALASTHLLDSPPEAAFDRLTRLTAGLIGAPVALVSLVDERRQFFKSALGLKEPWASRRETPLTHSFCQYATRDRAPLVVADAREHPVLRDNHAIRDLNVIAYAGMPLLIDGEAIGALCVIDDKPRAWTDDELRLLHDLAESVVSEIELRVALRRAREQKALTDALLDSMGDAVLGVDIDRRFILSNAVVRGIFEGSEVGKLVPPNWSEIHRSQREDGTPLPPEDGAIPRALRGLVTDGLVFTMWGPTSPAPVWVEASARPVRGADGEIIAAVGVYRDVTERKRVVDEKRRTEQMYRAIVEHLPNAAVFLLDRDLRYVAADGAIVRSLPRRAGVDELVGRRVDEVILDASQREVVDGYTATLRGERVHVEVQRGDRFFDVDTVPIYDGDRVTHVLAVLYDVTARRSELAELERARAALEVNAAELRKLSDTDELTGLLNRRGFMLFADREIKSAARHGRSLVMVFVDLNGMKIINDTLGHDVGDRALVDTATLLRRVFRGSDIVGRLGGDEFVVLASDAAEASTEMLTMRLRAALDAYNATSTAFRLSLSVGTAHFDPDKPIDLETLLAEADERMYEAKSVAHARMSAPRIKVR
jgi:diguanylate cyclase (GGDEF)-like protein